MSRPRVPSVIRTGRAERRVPSRPFTTAALGYRAGEKKVWAIPLAILFESTVEKDRIAR
jgi:hypothetical protein